MNFWDRSAWFLGHYGCGLYGSWFDYRFYGWGVINLDLGLDWRDRFLVIGLGSNGWLRVDFNILFGVVGTLDDMWLLSWSFGVLFRLCGFWGGV